MPETILYVDDEANLLAATRRTLGKRFALTTAQGGQQGLQVLQTLGSVPLVISDMRMPAMDGIHFLIAVKERWPDTVCMMLTGYADVDTAMKAVNEGRIFRFLTKPCPQETIVSAIEAGLRQYQLVMAERDLLQKTLTGSVKVLADVLSLVNPDAFSRTMRLRECVGQMISALKLPQGWQYEIAAMLSQIGCVTLPPKVAQRMAEGKALSEQEMIMVEAHPAIARRLLGNIPRLEIIAAIIERQFAPYNPADTVDPATAAGTVNRGGQMLRLALDYDRLTAAGLPHDVALARLGQKAEIYAPDLLAALKGAPALASPAGEGAQVRELSVWKLTVGMFAAEDIYAQSGLLVVPKGQEMTEAIIARLQNFAGGVGIREPIQALVPAK